MQKVVLKNGVELLSIELDGMKAQEDIVSKVIAYAHENEVELLRELMMNINAAPGAIVLTRLVKELVDLEKSSDDFKKVAETQKDVVLMLIGDKEPNFNVTPNKIKPVRQF